jgi:hypothetical protein
LGGERESEPAWKESSGWCGGFLDGGHYRGSASFKQSNFGISPIRIAGGTVKVKDEVKIEFDIVPVK